jgi:DNA helicase HerA-like ATPase
MDPTLLITGALAGASLIIMLRNTQRLGEIPLYKPKIFNDLNNPTEIKIKIGAKEYKGYILVADELPKREENLGEKILHALKASNVSATLINGIYLVEKDRLLSDLDEKVKKLEVLYENTKMVKYKKELEFIKEVYSSVLKMYKPYVGGLIVIVWSDEDSKVEALKSLLEVEFGISLRRIKLNTPLELLAPPAKVIRTDERTPFILSKIIEVDKGVVIGKSIEKDMLITLNWPLDFEKHVGVIGPTGKGKTVLLAGIAAQLQAFHVQERDPFSIVVVDPKGDLVELIENVADRVERITDISPAIKTESYENILNSVNNDLNLIKPTNSCTKISTLKVENGLQVFDLSPLENSIKGLGMTIILCQLIREHLMGRPKGRRVVIVDEAWRLREKGLQILETIIREGRSRLLHLVYAIHDVIDVNDIILTNTSTLIVFGSSNEKYANKIESIGFKEAREILQGLVTGEALVKKSNNELEVVRILNFKKLLGKTIRTFDVRTEETLNADARKEFI